MTRAHPFRRAALALAAATAALPGCGDDLVLPGPTGGSDRVDVILVLTGDVAAGSSAFDAHCVVCHVKDGQAPFVGPALAAVVPDLSDRQLIDLMLVGIGSMPPTNLDDQEAADLLAWLVDSFRVPVSPPDTDATDTDAADTDTDGDTDTDADTDADTDTDAADTDA